MKKIFTKLSAFVVCFALLLTCSFGAANLSVSAETELPTFTSKVGVNTYEYTVTGGEATIIKATAKGDVIIPETLDGYPVVALGDKAFYYQWDIESVTVPSCVKTIGDGCFRDCINMKSAVIEDGVEKIGAYAFYSFVVIWGEDDIEAEYYSSLESLVLPDSVKYIGESAFLDTLLSGELKLPASLQYLGESAFSGTRIEKLRIPATMVYNDEIFFSRIGSLKEIVIDAGNTNYHLDDELLMADSGKVALYFIGNIKTEVVVPDTTEVIASNCFTTTRVQKVTLPTSLREIEKEAFKSCGELTEIVIPDGVITIGDKAFSSCSKVVDIQLPTTLTTVGQDAFSNCSSLVKLSIPAGTLTLGDGAFGGCRSLQEVEFTGNDVTLGKSVFYNCLNMNKMTLSASKMYLGASLFAKTGIETLVIDSNDITTDPDLYLERELYYPGYKDKNIKKLVISKNVTTLNEALYLPVTIWQVEVEDGNTTYAIEENVLYNKDKTELIRFFSNNAEYNYRDKFTVPETVTKIGNKAFLGARVYLVELPSALEVIGEQAFYNSVVSGSQERYVFTLPASVKKIGSRAFGITPIRYFNIIEGNLEKLTPNMFHGAYALTDVYYTGDKEKLDEIISYTEGSYLSSCRFHYNTTSSEHPFSETIGKKATAHENGYYLYTCPCEQSYTLPIHKINEFIVAYSTVADHFSTEVSVAPAHQLPTRLIHGHDYTYQLSTYDAKDGHLAIKYSFMGDLYEGTYTKVEPVEIGAVKSLTTERTAANSAILTWKKPTVAKGYKIWRKEVGTNTWKLIATTSKLSYTDTSLAGDKHYQYKVSAYITVMNTCDITSDKSVTVDVLPYGNTLVKIDGVWRHVVNGKLVNDTTLVKYNGKYLYVRNGVYTKDTTLVKYNGKYHYVKNGVYTKGTTLVKYNDSYYYVKDGVLNYSDTLVKYNGKYFHVKNGKYVKDTTLTKYNGKYFYVKNGTYTKATTLAKYNGKYFYVKNGTYTKATTLAKYNGKYLYVKNGTYTKATTLAKYNGKYFYVKNGTYTKATTLVKYNGKYLYVKNGTYTKATTLVKYNGKYHYVRNGVYTKANTTVKYNGKTYKVKNGIAII